MKTDKLIRVIIPQIVRVRKYEVDIEGLKKLLKKHKNDKKLSNKKIAELANEKKTLVDHWFRNDECFAIPSEENWFKLKKILEIETDEFDLSITTFIDRDGVYDKSNRVYDVEGIAPTLTCAGAEFERFIIWE